MRLNRFLILTGVITLVALGYVNQQNKIYYFGYSNGKKQTELSNLLDNNNILRYNINKWSSLTCLDDKILQNVDFEIPSQRRLVRLETAEQKAQFKEPKASASLIVSFFSRARQAEAQTINR